MALASGTIADLRRALRYAQRGGVGWTGEDPVVVRAQGRASSMAADMIAEQMTAMPGPREAFEAGCGRFLDVGVGRGRDLAADVRAVPGRDRGRPRHPPRRARGGPQGGRRPGLRGTGRAAPPRRRRARRGGDLRPRLAAAALRAAAGAGGGPGAGAARAAPGGLAGHARQRPHARLLLREGALRALLAPARRRTHEPGGGRAARRLRRLRGPHVVRLPRAVTAARAPARGGHGDAADQEGSRCGSG